MKNVRFSRNGVDFEPTKQELKVVLDDFAKQLGESDKRIKVLDKALEFACNELPSPIVFMGNYMETVDDWCKYFKTQAKKEIENE